MEASALRRRASSFLSCWFALVAGAVLAAATMTDAVASQVSAGSDEFKKSYSIKATSDIFFVKALEVSPNRSRPRTLRYKKSNDENWILKVLGDVVIIDNLQSDTEYDIEEYDVPGLDVTTPKKTKVRTCPEQLPKQDTNIRLARSGPGWLDVRWVPVKDQRCNSSIYYRVQYTANNQKWTQWTTYGVFNKTNGEQVFRPSHPCATWDAEFCLLLTDEVMAGENHVIKVKPVRYDPRVGPEGDGPPDGNIYELPNAVANSSVSGPLALGARDPLSPCSTREPLGALGALSVARQGRSMGQRPVVVPVWAIVLAALLLVAAVVVVFLVVRKHRRSTTRKSLLKDASANSPQEDDSPEYRSSNVYDDCLPTHMGNNTLPENTSAHANEPLYERLQGMQGKPQASQGKAQGLQEKPQSLQGKPQGLEACLAQTLAKAAAAKAAADSEPTASANHYVVMASQPLYDDAQGLIKNTEDSPYYNISETRPESAVYMDPGSPLYDDTKGGDPRVSDISTGYNRPYSHAKEKPWRGW